MTLLRVAARAEEYNALQPDPTLHLAVDGTDQTTRVMQGSELLLALMLPEHAWLFVSGMLRERKRAASRPLAQVLRLVPRVPETALAGAGLGPDCGYALVPENSEEWDQDMREARLKLLEAHAQFTDPERAG